MTSITKRTVNARDFSTAMPHLRFLPILQLMRLGEASVRIALQSGQHYHGALLAPMPAIYVLRGVVRLAAGEALQPGRIGLRWPGQWVLPAALLLPARDGFSLAACEPAQILAIGSEAMLGAARKHPELALYLAEQCAAETAELAHWLQVIGARSVLGRIAQMLLYLMGRYGKADFRLPTTSTHLAHYAACSREAFTRSLSQLAQMGLIIRTAHSVRIIAAEALDAVR